MEACLSIKFAYLDWLTCKKCLLGGHGKARRTVRLDGITKTCFRPISICASDTQ